MSLDPALSPDPSVRRLVHRQRGVTDEMTRLRILLQAYAAHVKEPEVRLPMSPLVHYAMLDAPECGCPTCMDWECRRAEFVSCAKFVPKGHKWTICGCADCRFVGRAQLNYLATTNRRDLLIEMSFHARYHSHNGDLVMAWLEQEMKNPAYTVNWCAQEMSRYPMERWMTRCEMAVSGIVSGAVFRDTAGVTDAVASIGSSLGDGIGGLDAWLEP